MGNSRCLTANQWSFVGSYSLILQEEVHKYKKLIKVIDEALLLLSSINNFFPLSCCVMERRRKLNMFIHRFTTALL